MKRFLLSLLLCASCRFVCAQTVSTTAAPPTTTKTPAKQTPVPAPTVFLTPTPRPTLLPLPAASYRARLQTALDQLKIVEKHPTTDVRPILKPLDAPFLVKRADGKTQKVKGDEWDRLLSGVAGPMAAKLPRDQVRTLHGSLEKRLEALDDWTTPRAGGYYTAFDAQAVVSEAIARYQIRVGPPPLQQWIGAIKDAIATVIDNFFKWLGSLLPKTRTPTTSPTMPNISWLIFICWGVLFGILGFLVFLLARWLSGGTLAMWGIGRRRKKSEVELRDEDAALFQLAPEELRDRADLFAAQGNFREALRHRFISLLVLLDARGTWRYDIRRTNWEHIAALRRDESKRPLVAPLSDLTRAFDRVRYGDAPCDEEGWNSFQSGVRQIESQVGGRAVAR